MQRDSQIGKLARGTARFAVPLAVAAAGLSPAAGDDGPPVARGNVSIARRPLGPDPVPPGMLPAGARQEAIGRPANQAVTVRRPTTESSLVQMLGAELRLLTATARPTPEQRREIALAGGRALRLARADGGHGVFPTARDKQRAGSPGPHRAIRDALAAAALERLGPESASRYLAEWEARDEARNRAATAEIVARLDEALYLDAEQRERVTILLRGQWDSPIFPSPTSLAARDGYLPAFLPHLIGEALTGDQARLLANLPLVNFGRVEASPFDAADGVRHSVEDEVDDPDLKAALAEAGRP